MGQATETIMEKTVYNTRLLRLLEAQYVNTLVRYDRLVRPHLITASYCGYCLLVLLLVHVEIPLKVNSAVDYSSPARRRCCRL